MIDIRINPRQFEYDIQSMVQAFYMGHLFKINGLVEHPYRVVEVEFLEQAICARLYGMNQKLFEGQTACDLSDRRNTKNALKKLLYCLMVKDTGTELPWGNLTGIRPAKIPGILMEEGYKEDEIRKIMKDTYMISDEKLNLALDVSKMEKKVLENIHYRDGYSLYVGIPFCPTTCLYCSFTSYPIMVFKKKTDAYVEAVIREIEFLGKKMSNRELNTVYIGGGTPTTLEPVQLEKLIKALKINFDLSTVKEFTVEAGRPDSITKEKLYTLRKLGVSRISINPQTMNQSTLDLIGRRHTVEQVKDAFYLARKIGFDNINMDFIVGLPQEKIEDVKHSMKEALKLNPDSITIHSLALKRASRLNIESDSYAHMTMENSNEMMNLTAEYAKKMKMRPYYLYRQKNMTGNQENVGYAKEGCEGIYNILMMGDYQDVWAVGAGAVTKLLSKDRKEAKRIDTVKDVNQYIERIDEMIERKNKSSINS